MYLHTYVLVMNFQNRQKLEYSFPNWNWNSHNVLSKLFVQSIEMCLPTLFYICAHFNNDVKEATNFSTQKTVFTIFIHTQNFRNKITSRNLETSSLKLCAYNYMKFVVICIINV